MSSFSNGSFAASTSDQNQGANAFVARLNTASNVAGLATTVVAGAVYSGATIQNRSATNYVRAVVSFVAGALFLPGDDVQLVAPNASLSFSFDGDVIESILVQSVVTPAAGTITDASVLVAGITGTADVVINLVNG